MRNWLILLTLLANVTMVRAEDAAYLEKDQKAPFTGILIKPETVQDLRKAVIERDSLSQEKASFERSLELYKKKDELQEKKLGILLEQNDKLALRLGEERSMGTWERIGLISVGLVAAGIAAYGLREIKAGN